MALTLKSGFSFDYDNLFGEGKVTEEDFDFDALRKAHEAMKVMRETGFIKAHLSKDGNPEKVYFSKLPYITEENGKLNLNSPASIQRLHDFTEKIRNNVDAVVSLGIGGSFLGNKVLFDIFCGEFWNTWTTEQRKGLPKVYFSGQNIDPRRTGDIINHLKAMAAQKGGKYKVMLICISKSGGTLDTMSNFMVILDALKKDENIEVEIVAVTDPNMEKKTLLKQIAGNALLFPTASADVSRSFAKSDFRRRLLSAWTLRNSFKAHRIWIRLAKTTTSGKIPQCSMRH